MCIWSPKKMKQNKTNTHSHKEITKFNRSIFFNHTLSSIAHIRQFGVYYRIYKTQNQKCTRDFNKQHDKIKPFKTTTHRQNYKVFFKKVQTWLGRKYDTVLFLSLFQVKLYWSTLCNVFITKMNKRTKKCVTW